jgi:hypothetical protein
VQQCKPDSVYAGYNQVMNRRESIPNAQQQLLAAATLAENERKRQQDERLDDELDQTFPASDPIPWHLDVRQSKPARRER